MHMDIHCHTFGNYFLVIFIDFCCCSGSKHMMIVANWSNSCVCSVYPNSLRCLPETGTTPKCKAIILSKITSPNELEDFIAPRIAKRKVLAGKRSYVLIWYFRCQHKTTNPSTQNVEAILKNTNCDFPYEVQNEKDHDGNYPCT